AAEVYCNAKRVIGIYGMGLTQHVHGIENVEMIVNLLLLRGNIGREGAGVCPVRGHSNVQGQRTVGISEKPELVPLDKIKEQFGFEPPRMKGLNTIEACEGVVDGSVKAFIGLGGNFLRAVADSGQVERAWQKQRLTVHVATKLNRGHLFPGEVSYILPCIGRTEKDVQATGPQSVAIEDSTSCIHGSLGERTPASPDLLSEPAIVAGIAEATLAPNPKLPWAEWVGDYSKVRDAIAETYPNFFHDFNARMFTPGGFYKGNKARERNFETKSGKAEFAVPKMLDAVGFAPSPGLMRLITLRSNDQFNTTVYGYNDRFRGVKGTRDVLFISPADMAVHGLAEGDIVGLRTEYGDGVERRLGGLRVTPYSLPTGCIGTYYPEANVLIPLQHHAEQSFVLAAKSVPVRIERE
ncbi:MAG: molybdopterin dinucleotide binding domain-containing protein, partial [Janthinobacterium lividum]